MENERRNQIRYACKQQPEGTLSLTVDGHPMVILEVHDASPFGIGLLIDGLVTNGLEANLQYTHGTSSIEVFGSVVWNVIINSECRESSVGIFFQKQDPSSNVAFFNAITP